MTTETGHPNLRQRTEEQAASTCKAAESGMNRADVLRLVLITVGIQLLFRLMLLLRRWNY